MVAVGRAAQPRITDAAISTPTEGRRRSVGVTTKARPATPRIYIIGNSPTFSGIFAQFARKTPRTALTILPFWGALIGWLWLGATLTRWQSLGLVIGFCGVLLLVLSGSTHTAPGELTTFFVAILAGVLATVLYGVAANCAKRYLQNTNALVNAANSQIGASIVLAVPMIFLWPEHTVSWLSWAALIALGIFSTGLAYLLFFRLIESIGAQRAVTVVFVVPVFAVAFGAVFLGEIVTLSMVLAGAVVMLGSAMALRLLPRQR